jgi:hypothetical protein
MLDQREPRDQTRDEQEAPDGIIIEEIDEVQS